MEIVEIRAIKVKFKKIAYCIAAALTSNRMIFLMQFGINKLL